MPLYKSLRPNSETNIKIWKITESYNDLYDGIVLNEESKARVSKMKSQMHQCGFLSVRHLLKEFGYSDRDLFYDGHGKPHLKDGNHISITHSFTFSAVAVSNGVIGVDIEKQRTKIGLIAPKFIDYEALYLKSIDSEYIRKLTVIWCIKESLYKLFATKGLSFLQHTLVLPFTIEEGQTISWIDYNRDKYKFVAEYLEFEEFTCAYTMTAI